MAAKKKPASKGKPAADGAPKKERGAIKAAMAMAQKVASEIVPVIGAQQSNERQKQLLQFRNGYNTANKAKLIVTADEAPNTFMVRRPTGIPQLDLHLGGGFPAGGLSIVSGPNNAGKTFLIMLAMAAQQRLFGHNTALGFATVELAFDFIRAKKVGLRIAVPPGMVAEIRQARIDNHLPDMTPQELAWYNDQVGTFDIIRGRNGEEMLNGVLAANKTNLYQLIGIDSLSMLMPNADAAKDLEDPNQVAARAALQTNFIRHYTADASGIENPVYTSLVGISQIRSNQRAGSYAREWKTEGAHAVHHGKLIDVTVLPGEKIYQQINGQRVAVGKQLNWEISKGKAGTHDGHKGAVDYMHQEYLPQSVDTLGLLIEAAQATAVLTTVAGKYQVLYQIGDVTKNLLPETSGPEQLIMLLAQSPVIEMTMRQLVLARQGVQCLFVEEHMRQYSYLSAL